MGSNSFCQGRRKTYRLLCAVFGSYSRVEISDDGECIEADGETLARQTDGKWVSYPRPWEKWPEVSIEPHQADGG